MNFKQASIVLASLIITLSGCKNMNETKLTDAQRIEFGASTPEKISLAQSLFDDEKYKPAARVISKWIKKNFLKRI